MDGVEHEAISSTEVALVEGDEHWTIAQIEPICFDESVVRLLVMVEICRVIVEMLTAETNEDLNGEKMIEDPSGSIEIAFAKLLGGICR